MVSALHRDSRRIEEKNELETRRDLGSLWRRFLAVHTPAENQSERDSHRHNYFALSSHRRRAQERGWRALALGADVLSTASKSTPKARQLANATLSSAGTN